MSSILSFDEAIAELKKLTTSGKYTVNTQRGQRHLPFEPMSQ